MLYIPGASFGNFSANYGDSIVEMWDYKIDRNNNLLLIEPQIDGIVIDKVKINGEEKAPIVDCYYELNNSDNIDVVVNYTLHSRQAILTNYTPEFNATLSDCKLTLPVKVNSIDISPSELTDVIGNEIQLTATVVPENATNKGLVWSSDNPEVATVDNNGLLTLLKRGSATITAEATDGSGVKAYCSVVVSDLSGLKAILNVSNEDVKIYNTMSVLIFEGKYSDAKLDGGVYVVVIGGKTFKHIIK